MKIEIILLQNIYVLLELISLFVLMNFNLLILANSPCCRKVAAPAGHEATG
jgi:hypothetical protein